MSLEELPAMQFHAFQPWVADVCGYCGGPPAAHPAPEWLAECAERGVCPCCTSTGDCAHWCRLKGGEK